MKATTALLPSATSTHTSCFFTGSSKKQKQKRTRTLLAKDKFAMSSYLLPCVWGFVYIICILLRQQKSRLFSWAVGHVSCVSAAVPGPLHCGSLLPLEKWKFNNWFLLCGVFRRDLARLNDQASLREAACCTFATLVDVSISAPARKEQEGKGPEENESPPHWCSHN